MSALIRLIHWFRLTVLVIWPPRPVIIETKAPDVEPSQAQPPEIVQAEATEGAPHSAGATSGEAITVEAPPAKPAAPSGLNRHERRRLEKWERERRKHDKLVTPAIPNEIPRRKPSAKSDGPKPPRKKPIPPPEVPEDIHLIDGEDGKIYHERELFGEFTFRDTILEQLELYWIYLRRMQHHDPDSYGFYKRVGATIIPPVTNFLHKGLRDKEDDDKTPDNSPLKLTPWWKQNRPAFGCVTYGISKLVEHDERTLKAEKGKQLWVPKFFYFVKYTRPPPQVQPMSGGDIYKLTIWWDKPYDPKYHYKKGGTPTEYAVFLDRENIRVLRMCETRDIQVRHKRSGAHQHRGKMFSIPQRAWRIPEVFTSWAEDNKESPEHFLARIFLDTAKTFEFSNYGMVRVAVHNGDLTAQFTVDPRRMSYFFQDRDIVYTPNGAREACFHIVRAHERRTKHGVSHVKLHFRGAKEFTWAGYRVTVTIPQRDHIPLAEFDVGVSDEYWQTPAERHDAAHEPEVGEWLARLVDGRLKPGDKTDWDEIKRDIRIDVSEECRDVRRR